MKPTPSNTALAKPERLQSLLAANAEQISVALPAHIDVQRFARVVMTYARSNPAVFACDPVSVGKAIMDSAQLGLAPDGLLGSGYLVPFKRKGSKLKTCTFMPGWRGLVDLARRTGVVTRIEARLVREGDVFRQTLGTSPGLQHEPADGQRGEIVAAYAVAWLVSRGCQFEVMDRADLDAIRASSQASGSDSPWNKWPGEMCRKSAVKRLCKYLPLSPELAAAVAHDNNLEDEPTPVRDVPATVERPSGVAALDQALGIGAAEPPPDPEPEPAPEPDSEPPDDEPPPDDSPADRETTPHEQGEAAAVREESHKVCPFADGSIKRDEWMAGYAENMDSLRGTDPAIQERLL